MAGMKRLATVFVCAALLTACATRNEDSVTSLDDPKFVAWYKTATPYMRTALFITLCAAQGFSNGSIEVNLCISNMRRDARIRVEGRL
jgi:hypothetical protein